MNPLITLFAAVTSILMPPIEGAGLSGLYAGEVGGRLVVAGGCNFPDRPVTEGGMKRFYSDICSLEGDGWRHIGHLPEPSAYGAYITTGEGLLILGGAGPRGTSDAGWLITGEGTKEFCRLPEPLEQMAWCRDEEGGIYIAGGLSNGKPSGEVYLFKDGEWSTVGMLPRPIVQGIATFSDGTITVWGGYDPVTKEALRCGYRLNSDGSWSETTADVTFVGSACMDGYAVGGCDADIFTSAIRLETKEEVREYQLRPVEYYRFRGILLHFDRETSSWVRIAESPRMALAGAALTRQGNHLVVIGGEIKPGIRTPEAFRIVIDD